MQAIIQQQVATLTAKATADIRIKERPRLTYQNNMLYDVRFDDTHWIAKVFVQPDEYETSPQREYQSLQLLASLDIAPQPIAYLPYPEYPQPVVIYDYMVGEMWDRRKPSAHELAQLAEMWLLTYRVTRAGLWASRQLSPNVIEMVARKRRNYSEYYAWAEAHFPQGIPHAQRCEAIFDCYQAQIQALHDAQLPELFSRSDPRFANIIARSDGRIGFVDWEDAGMRVPFRTVADLILHPNQEDLLTMDEWAAFFDPYLAGVPLQIKQADIMQYIRTYQIIVSAGWLAGLLRYGVRQARAGQIADWEINGMPANRRLRRYMARTLSWEKDDFAAQFAATEGVRFFTVNL